MAPHFFYISDITNSLSFDGKIFRKKSMLEKFRANVLKLVGKLHPETIPYLFSFILIKHFPTNPFLPGVQHYFNQVTTFYFTVWLKNILTFMEFPQYCIAQPYYAIISARK